MARLDANSFQRNALFAARTFRGLSTSELSERSGVSRQMLSSLENGTVDPFYPSLNAVAGVLGFPLQFFFTPIQIPDREILHFRRQSNVPAKAIDRARVTVALAARVAESFRTFASFRATRLPGINPTDDTDIERAAEEFRASIGLKRDTPIVNTVRAAEAAGIHVGTCDPGDVPVDGFCWFEQVPVLILSSRTCWSRRRFSTMHEVGHLILHRRRASNEEQANRFAGAVLAPKAPFWREFPRTSGRLDWSSMLELKQRWGISLQAMIRRAYDLELISAAQYRTGNIHISHFGWRTSEPGENEAELPEVAQRFMGEMRAQGIATNFYEQSNLFESNVLEILEITEPTEETSKVVRLTGRQRLQIANPENEN
jgi:Zn-dependent peptidase ImmA (M78 family)/transcriptional regulator with XRE-family HTH domain